MSDTEPYISLRSIPGPTTGIGRYGLTGTGTECSIRQLEAALYGSGFPVDTESFETHMSESSGGYDDRTVRRRVADAADETDGHRSTDLECIVVRYRERPDRCTITPRECSEVDQLTHWLSVDVTAVVDLDEVR